MGFVGAPEAPGKRRLRLLLRNIITSLGGGPFLQLRLRKVSSSHLSSFRLVSPQETIFLVAETLSLRQQPVLGLMSDHALTEYRTLRQGSRRVWISRRSGQEWGPGTWSEQGPLPLSTLGTRKDQQRRTGVPSGRASRTLRCDAEKGGLLHLASLHLL